MTATAQLTLTELRKLHAEMLAKHIAANYSSPIDPEYADAEDLIDEIQFLIWDLEDETPVMGDFDENGDCI